MEELLIMVGFVLCFLFLFLFFFYLLNEKIDKINCKGVCADCSLKLYSSIYPS